MIYQRLGNINYNERTHYQLHEIIVNLIDVMQTVIKAQQL